MNIQKRLVLHSISMLCKNAIDKLDNVIYYKNMINSGEEINLEHFKALHEMSERDLHDTVVRIRELCNKPFL